MRPEGRVSSENRWSTLRVGDRLAERSYTVRIRPDSLDDLGEALRKDLDCERVVVITTPRVGALHYEALARGCARLGVRVDRLPAPDGDRAKTLDWLHQAVEAGYANADWMTKDSDLESLHGPEFDALVERARQNAADQRAK